MVLLLLVDYALMLRSKHIHFVAARAFGLACILFALAGSRGLAAARAMVLRGAGPPDQHAFGTNEPLAYYSIFSSFHRMNNPFHSL